MERRRLHPAAKGERFISVADEVMSMLEIAKVLRARRGNAARKPRTHQLPDWIVRTVDRFDPVGGSCLLCSATAATPPAQRRMLGWKRRTRGSAIVVTAESLIRLGIVDGHARHLSISVN